MTRRRMTLGALAAIFAAALAPIAVIVNPGQESRDQPARPALITTTTATTAPLEVIDAGWRLPNGSCTWIDPALALRVGATYDTTCRRPHP